VADQKGAKAAETSGEAGVMAGAGRYAKQSQTQHGAAAFGFPLIPDAVAGARVGTQGPVLLADFGAAQGTNSLEAVRIALEALGDAGAGRSVLVVHADIPGNDFTTLARTLETSPDRYDRERPDVLPLMAARSLYERFLPADGLHFGWTASTLHWLSEAPGGVRGHFFVQLSSDDDARRRFAERSAADWRAFLDARATELAPGAGVVFVDVAMGDDGLMGSEALFDALNDALEDSRDRGALNAEELERIVYPTWFRSLDELRSPFTPTYAAAGGGELELAELRPVSMGDPFRAQLDSGDAQGYAAAQVGFLQGFLAPSFAAALDPDRPDRERSSILDEVWSAARTRVAADAAAVSPDYRLVAGLVRRVAG
jgi:salicylate 1-O-methyltransferase